MDWTDRAIDQLYIEIGDRIRRARSTRSRNQAELASDVGLTRSSIANVEAGRQRMLVHSLVRIAESLDVPVGSLLPDPDRILEIADSSRSIPDLTEQLEGQSEAAWHFVTSAVRQTREVTHGSVETTSDRANGQ